MEEKSFSSSSEWHLYLLFGVPVILSVVIVKGEGRGPSFKGWFRALRFLFEMFFGEDVCHYGRIN